jgi:hypothetical protein
MATMVVGNNAGRHPALSPILMQGVPMVQVDALAVNDHAGLPSGSDGQLLAEAERAPDASARAAAAEMAYPAAVKAGVGYFPQSDGAASLKAEPVDPDSLAAFGDLAQYSWLRRQCIQMATHPEFEFTVMLAIAVSSISLILYRPTEDSKSPWNTRLFWAGAKHVAGWSLKDSFVLWVLSDGHHGLTGSRSLHKQPSLVVVSTRT